MLFVFFALLRLSNSGDPHNHRKAHMSPKEHMDKMNKMKAEIDSYRKAKSSLIDQLNDLKEKIHNAKQVGMESSALERELKEVRSKLYDLDHEFRQAKAKVVAEDPIENPPEFIGSAAEKLFEHPNVIQEESPSDASK